MASSEAPVTSSAADALTAQIELSRMRMLVGHMPRASLIVGGFAVGIIALVAIVVPDSFDSSMLLWLATSAALALVRTVHAMAYLRSMHRGAPHWRPVFLVLTLGLGLCWATLPWVLPLKGHNDLASTVIGAMIGMAATGALMLGFDRLHTRLWISPQLASASVYCATIGGPLGWFGVMSVAGFLFILWLESDRAHRRMGEMLRLRYESEELAQARALALKEAESLSAAKSRFLATMSHEMRTPLHGILGLSRMLRSELRSDPAQANMTLLQNAGEHLLGVINDVLDFSRLKENMLVLKPRAVHLPSLVADVCALADATARDKGVLVTMQNHLPDAWWLEADAPRLRQILTNLVGNAVKFTRQGHVIVRLRPEDQLDPAQARITFEVEDTGDGIPPEQLDRVFDAFHQVDTRDERRAGGTGLGLSIAQQICAAMGGQIRCESQCGVGSLFWFTLSLPRAATPGTEPVAPADAPEQMPRPRLQGTVLIAEDNPVNALVAQAMLEQTGLEVHVVENGQLALDWLAAHTADLILMDCHMPEMGGLEATRLLRCDELQRGATPVPIVAVSAGKYHSDDHRQCLAAGMNDYLSKPFHRDDLVRVLRRHLRRRPRAASARCPPPQPEDGVARLANPANGNVTMAE